MIQEPAIDNEAERRLDAVLFLAALALVATSLNYRFGMGNQVEQLPLVFRFLDASYLGADFFVRTGAEFGPRYYYAKALAGAAQFIPLSYVMLLAAVTTNAALAAISYLSARSLLRADKLTGCIAASLSVGVTSFDLGGAAGIHFLDYCPAAPAMPLALAALWFGIIGKPVLAAGLAAAASVAHPLIGTETGGLALAAAAGHVLLQGSKREPQHMAKGLARCALGGVVLAVAAYVLWSLPTRGSSAASLTPSEVVEILGRFRAPFHYLPSYFLRRDYVGWVTFSATSGVCFYRWWSAQGRPREALAMLVPPLLVVVACSASYFLVERWPSSIWTIAQVFRMLNTFKWLGLLCMAWQLAEWLREPSWGRRCFAWVALCGSGKAHPSIFLAVLVIERLGQWLHRAVPRVPGWLVPAVLLLGVWPFALLNRWSNELLIMAIGGLLWTLARGARHQLGRRLATLGTALTIVFVVLANHQMHWVHAGTLSPILVEADQVGDDADVASWCKVNTTPDAVFVTPPDFGVLRVLGRRAIVVDHTSIPFGAEAIREWYSRMLTCYGPVQGGGEEAMAVMDENYRHVTAERLTLIKEKYGVSHAVLFAETPSTQPVLYANASYKVIRF